ncbi:MAG: Amuc_1099 family pilus-like system protein [Verrucomicrobiota bacterium]
MDWIRSHYDRFAVLTASLFLIVCSFFIWRSAAQFGADFSANQAAAGTRKAPLSKAEELEKAAEKLRQPPQWTFGGRSGLFVPEKHFIAANGFPATLQTTEVHPPVPNEWLEQYNLPIADGDVLEQDPDKDGFTNLDEWQGKTDPTKEDSHPDYLTKLKLKSFAQEPFRIKFDSRVGDTYGLNTSDLKEPTQFRKVGETIAGTQFKIVKFTEKSEVNQLGTNVDVSELLLEHVESKEQLTLVKEKVAISPESVANFVYTWGGSQEITVKKDQQFSLKPQEEIKYKLIDVGPGKAVIVNLQKPNESIEIGAVTQ